MGTQPLQEGVETEEHFEFLRSIGCEHVQGYYFAKPMAINESRIPLIQADLIIVVMVHMQQVILALADEALVYEMRPAAVSVPVLMYHDAGNLGRARQGTTHAARHLRGAA